MSDFPGSREARSGAAWPIRLNMALLLLPCLSCLTIFLAGVVEGQTGGHQASAAADSVEQDKLARTVDEVKGGNWASVGQIVTEAGPVRAVPILHDLFAGSQDPQVKEWIAGELIKLGDKDGAYFDFMLVLANDAVENSPPFPFPVEPETTLGAKPQQIDRQDPDALRKEVTPEFLEWAKSRGISLNLAAQEAMQTIPGRLLKLGMTGNKRAIPVLRRGLSSSNFMIQVSAAEGLGELKDNESIPLIIEACERAPAYAAPSMALFGLRSFDDPRAQSVYQSYLAKLQDAAKARGAGQDTNLNADQPK
jgi:PBS lyase HEAT-like repeat